ncbi:MAG: DUF983 domain-containing protein [Chloroflexi bacterium]|nr:MAG: DUF983 domain-containing protein [Chloroflexota bacterium]
MNGFTRILPVLLCRCPRCLRGPIFAGLVRMHKSCPVCHARYEREQGYFMNSIFVGYLISFVLVIPVIALLVYLRPSPVQFTLGIAVAYAFIAPITFRYARVIWMHMDEMMDPR